MWEIKYYRALIDEELEDNMIRGIEYRKTIDINQNKTSSRFPKSVPRISMMATADNKFEVPEDGNYTFYVGAYDGIVIEIDGKVLTGHKNNTIFNVTEETLELKKDDTHEAKVQFYQEGGPYRFTVEIQGPRVNKQLL
jgi:hypothetical protein